ncbi:S8 family serine peptidase [Oscillatoria amoena NRMC-F 0135]|nr:S8 family serine peptidase [Desertifilum sp.]MDI9637607.1 S8 family serine peptidase [Geitlerinema splendidum]MDL5044835.1 S8 family serine peptidase [Oscillatoria amoena NRMC-F 0135]
MNGDSANSPEYPTRNPEGASVPEENIGLVLQRGGDELILEKVRDRFTVVPQPNAAPSWTSQIPAIRHQNLPHIPSATRAGSLQEFIVQPEQLEDSMQAARQADAVAFASHVYHLQDDPGALVYLTDQLTLQFAPDIEPAVGTELANAAGLQLVKPIEGLPNAFVFQVTRAATENPVKIANRLMSLPQVLAAEPNIIIATQSFYRPRDPLYPQQWYLQHAGGSQLALNSHIDVERAWDITRGVRSVVVAVTDDAIDLNHPDLQGIGKIVAPRDFKDQDFLPLPTSPEENHGTACAGLCVAEENGQGMVGVAPGCALMPIRTTGFLDDESIEQIFSWASSRGAAVISCSWGPAAVNFPLSLRQSAALNRAATQGRQGKGCVIVFAAGNANRPVNGTIDEQGWPNNVLRGPTRWLVGFAVHPDAIAVSASTSLGQKAAYSNWGNGISVCAPSNNAPPGMWLQQTGYIPTPPAVTGALPGLGMLTADRVGAAGYSAGDYTSEFGGTSSACPIVAGVAALVLSANPDLTAAQVKQILQQTADKIVDTSADPQFGFRRGTYNEAGYSEWFGYGKVNAFRAVSAARQMFMGTPSVARRLTLQNNSRINLVDNNPQGVTSAIAVSDAGQLRDLQVAVDVEHSFLGDLEIYLLSPTNRRILLQSRTLGRNTRLETTYSLQTVPALRQLLNLPVRGNWQLLLIDFAAGDTGSLRGWQLTIGV